MKQNDIILVVVAVVIGATLSIVLSKTFFGPANREEKVEVVEKITSEFTQPSDKYFNANSFNPTQNIQIGDGTNQVNFGQ